LRTVNAAIPSLARSSQLLLESFPDARRSTTLPDRPTLVAKAGRRDVPPAPPAVIGPNRPSMLRAQAVVSLRHEMRDAMTPREMADILEDHR
jgi:hypothetical protein